MNVRVAPPIIVTHIEDQVRQLIRHLSSAHSQIVCHQEELPSGEITLAVTITVEDDSRILIGNHGSHLAALEHLVRCIVRRTSEVPITILTLDVNGYRAQREQGLKELAETAARRAAQTSRTISLEPMSAPDRRTIHTALADRADIQTTSVGTEPNRRVLIKPVFL